MDNQGINNSVNQLLSTSPNFRTDLAKKLEELVPEAIADGKVDVVKLKELLAEDAGEPNERFGLFWPGKKQALRAAQDPTTATLKPAKDESKDWDTTNNIFIEGDNLEVLKVLQKQYHNSIKMIYIDPPYNTGKDFVYPDNFKEGLQNYLEFSQQVDEGNKKISTNTETAGRYHSNWLNMMYPRLKLARNLLTDDGVIFISIDDAEQANLKKICDEIFGEDNVEIMVWNKESEGSSGTLKATQRFRSIHEYIIVAYRNKNLTNFIKVNEPLKGKENELQTANLAVNSDNERCDHKNYFTITNPSGDKFTRQWKWSKDEIERLIQEDLIFWGSDGHKQPRLIIPTDERRTTFLLSILLYGGTTVGRKDFEELMGKTVEFSYPKPIILMKKILGTATYRNSIILDFFAGSATTAHAIMQLNAEDGGNRKHIMVQLPEPTDEKSEAFKAGYKKISDIARERINRAGEKIKADFADKLAERETPLDVGYRTYKLADTNFTKWQSAPTGDLTELQARLDLMRESSNDNASEEDLLVEVLLKMGLPLTTRTKTVDVDGLHVHQVVAEGDLSEGQPVLYLNEHVKPTLEQLRAIITDLTPSKFVILDDAFQGDNQLKTNLVQTCKSYDVELWTV